MIWANGKPGQQTILVDAAVYALGEGRIRAGQALFAQALAVRKANGLSNVYAAPQARLLYDLGLVRAASASLGEVPQGYDSPDYRYALNELGDETMAARLLKADLAAAPADTLLHQVYAAEEHAVRALRHGNAHEALTALEPAMPYQWRNLDVPYLRGQALLAAGDGRAAALTFQSMIDHPGVEPHIEHASLAWLGLARARRLQHDIIGARAAYATFLGLWKNADPDVPVLVQAKDENRGLTSAR
jgi:predicted Zn-dependent protease